MQGVKAGGCQRERAGPHPAEPGGRTVPPLLCTQAWGGGRGGGCLGSPGRIRARPSLGTPTWRGAHRPPFHAASGAFPHPGPFPPHPAGPLAGGHGSRIRARNQPGVELLGHGGEGEGRTASNLSVPDPPPVPDLPRASAHWHGPIYPASRLQRWLCLLPLAACSTTPTCLLPDPARSWGSGACEWLAPALQQGVLPVNELPTPPCTWV